MITKIAVISSAEFLKRIQAVSSQVSNIEIDGYIYQQPQEANELTKQLKPCDVVFYSGALPYYFSKESRKNLPVPYLYLAPDEMTFATSLLSVSYNKKIPLDRISVDLIDSSIISNVLNDINIIKNPLYVMNYRHMLEDKFEIEKVVQFHEKLWKEGKVDLALTSIHAVFDQLQLLEIPTMRMTDPINSLVRGLQDAKAQSELVKSQSAQAAVGYITFETPNTDALEAINTLVHSIQASIQQLNDTLFALYCTRGKIEELIEQNLLKDFLMTCSTNIQIGFGFGATITEADQNAQVALRFAEKDSSESCGYILTESKELLGPFPHTFKLQSLVNDQPELLKIAKETKLSPANLSKIIQFVKNRQSIQFTAADLSLYLQVTRRSTERIIKKLVDHGYIRIVGEEMPYHQGRPRALYELDIPVYC